VSVGCGWDHCLAVTQKGELYAWGSGANGKLGCGDEKARETPCRVVVGGGERVSVARAGCEHSACVTEGGDLYTWGQGDSGR
jgi:alpha-tubulin suppressor-like RCC1 family protein